MPFFYDVEEADCDETEVDDHLPETEETRAGDDGKLTVDDGPGHHEDYFNVEEDEQHRNHIEADAEAAARIAYRLDAALVGGQLGLGIAMAANEI